MIILNVTSKNQKEVVRFATEYLKKGKVIIYPTDTVYGILADATNKKAVQRIFKIKRRSIKNPVPFFVGSLKIAKDIAEIDKKQERVISSKWPGKTTFVLKRKRFKKKIYGVDKNTIAIRIPKHKLILKLFKNISFPLAQTSANISGKPTKNKILEIMFQFKGQRIKPDLFVDAGDLKSSKPSAIIDLIGPRTKILRK